MPLVENTICFKGEISASDLDLPSWQLGVMLAHGFVIYDVHSVLVTTLVLKIYHYTVIFNFTLQKQNNLQQGYKIFWRMFSIMTYIRSMSSWTTG